MQWREDGIIRVDQRVENQWAAFVQQFVRKTLSFNSRTGHFHIGAISYGLPVILRISQRSFTALCIFNKLLILRDIIRADRNW